MRQTNMKAARLILLNEQIHKLTEKIREEQAELKALKAEREKLK